MKRKTKKGGQLVGHIGPVRKPKFILHACHEILSDVDQICVVCRMKDGGYVVATSTMEVSDLCVMKEKLGIEILNNLI